MSDADRVRELEQKLAQTELLYKQEQGKRIAVERENAEVKRQSKIIEEQAAALQAETNNALMEGAEQMKIHLAVSQGIWAFAHMGRSFLARKVAAARVVHREQQMALLVERIINSIGKDPAQLQTAIDQAQHIIATVKRDGEAIRVQVAEAAMANGIDEFMKVYDSLLAARNDVARENSHG